MWFWGIATAVAAAAEDGEGAPAAAAATDPLQLAQAATADMRQWASALTAAGLTGLSHAVAAVLHVPLLAAAVVARNVACLHVCLSCVYQSSAHELQKAIASGLDQRSCLPLQG